MTIHEVTSYVLKKERGTFRVHDTLTGNMCIFNDVADALMYMENVDAVCDLPDDAFRILEIYGWSLAPA